MPEEKEGRNRGYAVVQFENPQEAYTAIREPLLGGGGEKELVGDSLLIGLFHGQMLTDRPMIVRMVSWGEGEGVVFL